MSLDREIEDLLAVDPSPEFVAKVRQRVAVEPAPRLWWFSWRLATAGAGLAALATAALLWPDSRPAPPATVPPVARHAGPVAVASEPDAAPAPAPSHPRTLARSNRLASPVVLIQQKDAEAMNLLIARVREGAMPDMTEVLAAVDATGPEWIAIPDVVIEPIPSGEGE